MEVPQAKAQVNAFLVSLPMVHESKLNTDDVLYVQTLSPMWGFVDDLVVQFKEHQGKTMLWVHSESRLGYDDLNANYKRIQKLLKKLDYV